MPMSYCENGWEALLARSALLYTWTIPTKDGDVRMTLRHGSVGFILCHFVLWFAETIEPLVGKVLDDWSYAWRYIRGTTSGPLSNHAGYAVDLNATRHPLGREGTFAYRVRGVLAYVRIRARLALYAGVLRWGGDYTSRKDEMHFEISNVTMAACEKVARRLMATPRGKRILEANPTQRAVILS